MTQPAASNFWARWRGTFPLENARRATEHLANVWARVSRVYPDRIKPSIREDKITEFLWYYIELTSEDEARLSGKWSYEDRQVFLPPNLSNPIKRIRSDITYFSDRENTRLFLVFEFKKLKDSGPSRSAYQGENGMRRFVDGYYSIRNPLASMVGMVNGNQTVCVENLKHSLNSDKARNELCMVSKNNHYLRVPSTTLHPTSQFDTEHRRPADQAPNNGVGTTTLAHIFLEFR